MKKDLTGTLLIFVFMLVASCGYTIHGKTSLPFSSFSIEKITNKTYEPGIDVRMRRILTEELVKSGFTLNPSSDYKIEGSIDFIELRILSEKAGVAVEYEVNIKGDFKLKTPSHIRSLRASGSFMVSFTTAENLETAMVLKEKAIEQALRDLSNEIIASIIHEH